MRLAGCGISPGVVSQRVATLVTGAVSETCSRKSGGYVAIVRVGIGSVSEGEDPVRNCCALGHIRLGPRSPGGMGSTGQEWTI